MLLISLPGLNISRNGVIVKDGIGVRRIERRLRSIELSVLFKAGIDVNLNRR